MATERLSWSPRDFWEATAAEMDLVIEGLQGRFTGGVSVTREEVRRAAAAFGQRKSIRNKPVH